MFGRRNPDRPLDNQTRPLDTEIDLDLLDTLPDIQPSEQPQQPAPPQADPAPAAPPHSDQAWQSAALPTHSPGLSQLLRAAESAAPRQPAEQDLPGLFEAAPAPAPQISSFAPEPQPSAQASWLPAPASYAPPVQAAQAASAVAPSNRARTVAESVIGPDDFFDGRYRSERGVRIQGNARGSIESRQYIFVETGAQVEADLSAEEITIAGDFTGKINCRGRLEVTSSGKIQGQIETALLVVQEGGSLDGQLSMRAAQAGEPAAS